MKPFSIAYCFTCLWLTPMMFLGQAAGQTAGQTPCQATVRASVAVAGPGLSLADLLDADTCPALRRASAHVPLGKTPLAGSVRVLAGEDVRTLLRDLVEDARPVSGGSATSVSERIMIPGRMMVPQIIVPERITVRRAGARASCADIVRRIPGSFATPPVKTDAGAAAPSAIFSTMSSEVNCGAADRIPQNTPLEFSSPVWDPALRGWEVYARCVQPADCVPFLVRESRQNSRPLTEPAGGANRSTIARLVAASSQQRSSEQAAPGSSTSTPRVRAGQTVTLLWDQDGIRLVVPAVALDAGTAGEKVRARIVRGGTLVPAIVVSTGLLRAAS
jgi:hypothetical protein